MNPNRTRKLTRIMKGSIVFSILIGAGVWTAIALISANWNIDNLHQTNIDFAIEQARANWNKDGNYSAYFK